MTVEQHRGLMDERAIELHERTRGKISVELETPLETTDDLSLAYSPGVAAPCREIARDPSRLRDLTVAGRAVAVVTDGSAVLGLGCQIATSATASVMPASDTPAAPSSGRAPRSW